PGDDPPGGGPAVAADWLGRLAVSLITDPRVQDGVEQVGHDVADDHDEACDQQPAHDDEAILAEDRIDDYGAHPPPLENVLGDDGTTESAGDGQRGDGG